jgi:hypothetical protein
VYGYQPSGAARTLFLFGIAVGAVTSLALRLLTTNLVAATTSDTALTQALRI